MNYADSVHVVSLVGLWSFQLAVEHCCNVFTGRDLVNMAKKRPNVIPIIEDARHPAKYRMLVPMVDVIFADVAQPDQVSAIAQGSVFDFFPLEG